MSDSCGQSVFCENDEGIFIFVFVLPEDFTTYWIWTDEQFKRTSSTTEFENYELFVRCLTQTGQFCWISIVDNSLIPIHTLCN